MKIAPGERLLLEAKRYLLEAPIRVPIMGTLEGAGRGTSLVAAGDFPCVELEGSYAHLPDRELQAAKRRYRDTGCI